jgi:hypothetical protein
MRCPFVQEVNRLAPGDVGYLALLAKHWSDLTFYYDVATDKERQLVNLKALEYAQKVGDPSVVCCCGVCQLPAGGKPACGTGWLLGVVSFNWLWGGGWLEKGRHRVLPYSRCSCPELVLLLSGDD